jgi:D-serine deaminase-like pyridoxal phosphate-dependent protein
MRDYSINKISTILTPALAIYTDIVEHNIDRTLHLLEKSPERWRPHVKTAKLRRIMQMLTDRKVAAFKCATTAELVTACESGASDVLLAFPVIGANALRVMHISQAFPHVAVSVLADSMVHIEQWHGSNIGIFVDVNPGMNRTGVQANAEQIVQLARCIEKTKLVFRPFPVPSLIQVFGTLNSCTEFPLAQLFMEI